MSELPLAKRRYDVFLSHAHEDKPAVADAVYRFCKGAGLEVFYDTYDLSGRLREDINEQIANSRAGIAIVSRNSVTLPTYWPKREWELFKDQWTAKRDFKIVPMRLDGSELPDSIKNHRAIDLRSGFDVREAVHLLGELHTSPQAKGKLHLPAVYLSRGSASTEVDRATELVDKLGRIGVQAVRDASINTEESMLVRVERIMQSCQGAVAILSNRQGTVSPYILAELMLALELQLPLCVIVDQGLDADAISRSLDEMVRIGAGSDDMHDAETLKLRHALERRARFVKEALRAEWLDGVSACALVIPPGDWVTELRALVQKFEPTLLPTPRRRAQSFIGHLYHPSVSAAYAEAARCLSSVTGMICRSGDEFRAKKADQDQQAAIIHEIRSSTFAIFDITRDAEGPAINTLVEAGIALGARVPMYLVARGTEKVTEPDDIFMLNNQRVYYYEDEFALVGLMRKIGVRYRRATE